MRKIKWEKEEALKAIEYWNAYLNYIESIDMLNPDIDELIHLIYLKSKNTNEVAKTFREHNIRYNRLGKSYSITTEIVSNSIRFTDIKDKVLKEMVLDKFFYHHKNLAK